MTNEALFRLFSKFGNVISARIMVEKATGRSRGFGEKHVVDASFIKLESSSDRVSSFGTGFLMSRLDMWLPDWFSLQ